MSKAMTILVVDPDQAFRESLANLLLVCGVERVEMASGAAEALEKIAGADFDVILMDIFIPEIKGLHFLKKLRKRIPKTKIIFMIEDQKLPGPNGLEQTEQDFPTILKSIVIRNLPQLLANELDSMSSEQ